MRSQQVPQPSMVVIYLATSSTVMHMSVHFAYNEFQAVRRTNIQGTSIYALEKGIKIFPKEVCLHVSTSLPSFKKEIG